MTKKEIYEWIQMHHPQLNEVVMERLVNKAMDDFCEQTEILKQSVTVKGGSVSNQRYYTIPENVLKIEEMRINELPISRIMDTGIIDTTLTKGSVSTDEGADGTGTDGTEESIATTAAAFSNMVAMQDGSHPNLHNNSKYIQIPKEVFAEVDGTAHLSMNIWVKFGNYEYLNTGTIFNNFGSDITNGRCGMFFNGEDIIKGGGWTNPVKHFYPNSFSAEMATTNENNYWSDAWNATVGYSKIGVASTHNYLFKNDGIASPTEDIDSGSVHNKWFMLTMVYDGDATTSNLKLFINGDRIGNYHTPFRNTTSTTIGPYSTSPQHWTRGSSAWGPGLIKPHIGSGNYLYGDSHTLSAPLTLGITKLIGSAGQGNINPSSILGSEMSNTNYYPEGTLVYPFEGYMRNLLVTSDALTPTEILNLYNKGVCNLVDTKSALTTDTNARHFYEMSADANDSIGSINGSANNGLDFRDVNLPGGRERYGR
tara:strand:- start:21751 stop:23193 length:1443 start_codon:yes stop_codon:yes gene_type:complete